MEGVERKESVERAYTGHILRAQGTYRVAGAGHAWCVMHSLCLFPHSHMYSSDIVGEGAQGYGAHWPLAMAAAESHQSVIVAGSPHVCGTCPF